MPVGATVNVIRNRGRVVEVRYARAKLGKQLGTAAARQRAWNVDVSKAFARRHAEMRAADTLTELLLPAPGRWEEMKGDRAGDWSARLTRNYRLIVADDGPGAVVVLGIEDYH